MIWRIYLVDWRCWREFGIDYYTREAADAAADRYRAAFPHLRYVVRGGRFRPKVSQFVEG